MIKSAGRPPVDRKVLPLLWIASLDVVGLDTVVVDHVVGLDTTVVDS